MSDPNIKVITISGAAGGGADPKPKAKSFKKLNFKVVHHVSFTKEEFLAKFAEGKTPEQQETMWTAVCESYAAERKDGIVEVEHADWDAAQAAAEEAVEQWVSDAQ